MKISYDPAKDEANIKTRGLSFAQVVDFDFVDAIYKEDARKSYPEIRMVALGYLTGRLHVLCYTPTNEGIRVISFRKANIREVKYYEDAKTTNE